MPYGIDSNPIKGMTAIYSTTGITGQEIIIGYVNTNQITKVGETRIFSTDSEGGNSFNIYLADNGICYLGQPSDITTYNDYLVKFNEMKSAFNQFTSDFNTFILSYNSHTHPSAAGETSAPIIPATATEANMDTSKTDSIKVY